MEEKFVKVCERLYSGMERSVEITKGEVKMFGVERGLRQGFPFVSTFV